LSGSTGRSDSPTRFSHRSCTETSASADGEFTPRYAEWRERDEPRAARALWGLAWVEFWAGRWELAAEHASRAHEISSQYGHEVPRTVQPGRQAKTGTAASHPVRSRPADLLLNQLADLEIDTAQRMAAPARRALMTSAVTRCERRLSGSASSGVTAMFATAVVPLDERTGTAEHCRATVQEPARGAAATRQHLGNDDEDPHQRHADDP